MSDGSTVVNLSREEIAKREIGRTDISAGLAWLMTIAFLLTLTIPPTVQLVNEVAFNEKGSSPSSLELWRSLPETVSTFHRAKGSFWSRVLVTNRQLVRNIEEYEKQLEEHSLLTQRLLGPTQQCLTSLTGLGNENVYVGRDGWLFYRPDVDYLTGPGFLEPSVLHRRTLGGNQQLAPPQPDPRLAIVEFHGQLARRGIQLILMPVPGKSAIHPEFLSSRFNGVTEPLENASFRQFKQEMEQAGVLVFDPAAILMQAKRAMRQQGVFWRTDTHWTPEALQIMVEQLKQFIDVNCHLPTTVPIEFKERTHEVQNLGDIATMLHLPENQVLFPRETATTREVLAADGRPWQADSDADILLLGDSFTNIFSLPEMNWGVGGGLAERLGFVLQRKIDRMAQNDGGSHAVRQALYQQLARGHDRLRGKRLVIWQFAARELAFGDWKQFPMPDLAPAGEEPRPTPLGHSAGEYLVQGTVRAATGAPQPGSVPYRDAVMAVHLDHVQGLAGSFPKSEIVVYLWGLRDNRLLAAAKLAPGQTVKWRLTPWDEVRTQYERFNRIELDDPEFRLAELPIYWAEDAP